VPEAQGDLPPQAVRRLLCVQNGTRLLSSLWDSKDTPMRSRPCICNCA